MTRQAGYHSYMLRIWQTSNGEKSVWSASLQKPGTDERLGFASLEALFCFLRNEAAGTQTSGEDTDPTEIR